MSDTGLDTARKKLKALAERGIFRSFAESKDRSGRHVYKFVWLVDAPFTLVIDPARNTLQFKELLRGFPAHSEDYQELRKFIRGRMDPDLRPHRRVDPDRATLTCNARGEAVSLTLTLNDGDYAYGVEKLLNVVNELFGQLQLYRPEYMIQEFGLPED